MPHQPNAPNRPSCDLNLSKTRCDLLDLIHRLRSAGTPIDIDLPQIVVVGSQGVGKSSIIESISGIIISGSTRCPTECRITRTADNPWECRVSLRFTTDARGQPLPQVRMHSFGDIITAQDEVEERIRRAQRAILNPNTSIQDFLTGEDVDPRQNEVAFSSNCISVHISGPDVVDFSFCDLPGLIASVSGRRGSDIKLVEDMVSAYMQKPNCIILLAVSCEADFEDQGALRLAKRYDPDGRRTTGVLTKPDRIVQGSEAGWLELVKNTRDSLHGNWFCVKPRPTSRAPYTDTNLGEAQWFSSTSPWSTLDSYQHHIGTPHLLEALDTLSFELMLRRLPDLRDKLDLATQSTMALLARLPKEPSQNPQLEISELLNGFVNEVETQITGIPGPDSLFRHIQTEQDAFRRQIRATTPEFRPFTKKNARKHTYRRPSFLDDEGDCDNDNPSGRGTVNNSNIVYIDEVLTRAQHSRTRELPGSFPFIVQSSFIYACLDKWHSPAKSYCATVHEILTESILRIAHKHLHGFGQNNLLRRIQTIVREHIKSKLRKAEEQIDWLYSVEGLPFTLNTHYFYNYRDKFLASYRSVRYRTADHGGLVKRLDAYELPTDATSQDPDQRITNALDAITALGIPALTASDLVKLLPPDPAEHAISIMADVRAYFQVAYKRYTDMVPLAVDHDLVRGLTRDLRETLYEELGFHGPQAASICSEFAQEDMAVSSRRAELRETLEHLRNTTQEVQSLEYTHRDYYWKGSRGPLYVPVATSRSTSPPSAVPLAPIKSPRVVRSLSTSDTLTSLPDISEHQDQVSPTIEATSSPASEDTRPLAAVFDHRESVDRKLKGLLNRLTPDTFEPVSDQIIAWANESESERDGRTLIQLIRLIFEKATNGVNSPGICAQLCRKIMEQISAKLQDDTTKDKGGTPITGRLLFRKYLLGRCQEDFERGWARNGSPEVVTLVADETSAGTTGIAVTRDSFSDEDDTWPRAKRPGHGLIAFIGELFKQQLVTERVVRECVDKLLGNLAGAHAEEIIAALCKLFLVVGHMLDTPKNGTQMDSYLARMQEIAISQDLGFRVHFLLEDVVDLREHEWCPRKAGSRSTGSKTSPGKDPPHSQSTASRGKFRRGADSQSLPSTSGIATAGGPAPRPPKGVDLTKLGYISKGFEGSALTFGPQSRLSSKESIALPSPPQEGFPSVTSKEPQRRKLVLSPRTVHTEPKAITEDEEAASPIAREPAIFVGDAKNIVREASRELFLSRDLAKAEYAFHRLPPEHHPRLVDELVCHAIYSGDDDALLVANLLERSASNKLYSSQAFEDGFVRSMEILDDVAVDEPRAVEFMAIMMRGSMFSKEQKIRLASKSVHSVSLLEYH